jgi:hypothetical protein
MAFMVQSRLPIRDRRMASGQRDCLPKWLGLSPKKKKDIVALVAMENPKITV